MQETQSWRLLPTWIEPTEAEVFTSPQDLKKGDKEEEEEEVSVVDSRR